LREQRASLHQVAQEQPSRNAIHDKSVN
jgi:hypothetical protein